MWLILVICFISCWCQEATKAVPTSLTVTNIHCSTRSKENFDIEIYHEWAPNGAKRFIELVEAKFFDNSSFFRVLPGFLVQFGIAAKPEVHREWQPKRIQDDPNLNNKFKRGYLSFAGGGENSRSTEVFIAYKSSDHLGKALWEVPIGVVTSGMMVIDNLHSYGDVPPWGKGPDQTQMYRRGNEYLAENFPLISYIERCAVQIPIKPQVKKDPKPQESNYTLYYILVLVLLVGFFVYKKVSSKRHVV